MAKLRPIKQHLEMKKPKLVRGRKGRSSRKRTKIAKYGKAHKR